MDLYVYDPQNGTIFYKDQTVPFYCGPDLDDIAIILLDLHFKKSNLQETFIRLATELQKNRIDQVIQNKESKLGNKIESQISFIKNTDSSARVSIQDVNKLIEVMGGDIIFTMNNSHMINHYLTLLLIKKVLS